MVPKSQFGKTGEALSAICLGTMMFGDRCSEAEADAVIGRALELGVNFVDTAPMYCKGGTEEMLGRILRGRRDRVFLVSKVNSVAAAEILSGIDESLRRLRTDRLDLFLIHWPKEGMRPEEVMGALHEVVRAGKARFVGCSNYPAWLLGRSNALAGMRGWTPFAAHQVPYNLVERGIEVEVLPQAASEGLGLMVYRALLAGVLSGKYLSGAPGRGEADPRLPKWNQDYAAGLRALLRLAGEKRCTPSQLAIAWARAKHPLVFPIVGVSRLAQLEEAAGSLEVELSPAEADSLAAAFDSEPWEESGGAYRGLRRSLKLVA
jgi:aryl-alcohol dehydrogenase-like predicted oxidoreductase